jgi:hypothetical protein
MFISEMRNELSYLHLSPSPWNNAARIHLKDISNDGPHTLFFEIEAGKETLIFHGLEWRLPFFKTTGCWHGVALKEGTEVPVHLHRDTRYMCSDLVGGPPGTRTDCIRVGVTDSFEKRVRFATSDNHVGSMLDRYIEPIYLPLTRVDPGEGADLTDRRLGSPLDLLKMLPQSGVGPLSERSQVRLLCRPTSVVLLGAEPP